MAKEHVENLNYRAVASRPWRPLGMPEGAMLRPLAIDSDTGALTGIIELPTGFNFQGPVCSDADMQLFVLDGELDMGDAQLLAGAYCYYPANGAQPSWSCSKAVTALAIFPSAPAFAPCRSDARDESSIPALDTWAMQWTDPLAAADPSVPFRTGVMVKILRVDPVTGASTHMAGMVPGWFSYGMEVHPVYEENYCLSGDVHIAEVGDGPGYTMTEGTFLCRPPGIPHGPVLSKNGNVNLVYAHGRLGIDYKDNPRSETLVRRHLVEFPWR